MKRIFHLIAVVILLSDSSYCRNVGFLYALEKDRNQFLLEIGGQVQKIDKNGKIIEFVHHRESKIYLKNMGSGAVRTAVSTESLLGATNMDLVISVGPVGLLDHSFSVEDILVVSRVLPWQTIEDLSIASPKSFKALLPQMPKGIPMSFLENYKRVSAASGEAFIKSTELKNRIRTTTDAEVVDMNLFGLLVALDQRDIPSLHVRIISDEADENASQDFAQFRDTYNGKLGKLVAELIINLPSDMTDPENYPELEELFQGPTDRDLPENSNKNPSH